MATGISPNRPQAPGPRNRQIGPSKGILPPGAGLQSSNGSIASKQNMEAIKRRLSAGGNNGLQNSGEAGGIANAPGRVKNPSFRPGKMGFGPKPKSPTYTTNV